jgi:cephalosporin-C deacetylase-like acetyl esterase
MRLSLLIFLVVSGVRAAGPLPNTKPLEMTGDITSNLVAGVDRFLLAQLANSETNRARFWKRDFSSAEAYTQSVETNRARLAYIIGARDRAMKPTQWPTEPRLIASTPKFDAFEIRWPAFADVSGDGLLLKQKAKARGTIIAIPDADIAPEQLVGIDEGVAPESQFALRLAEAGFDVAIPALVDRTLVQRRGAKLTNREYLYRSAFVLGRHLIGYEVLKVQALADFLGAPKLGLIGHGEGGLIALCAAALDPRFESTLVSGFFNDRRGVWNEPIDRNVFRLLDESGDAEIASLIAPRGLIIEAARGPELTLPSEGGAPSTLTTPALGSVQREFERARRLTVGIPSPVRLKLVTSGEDGRGAYGSDAALNAFISDLLPQPQVVPPSGSLAIATPQPRKLDPAALRIHELDRHNQQLLIESPYTRAEFMKPLYTNSLPAYNQAAAAYREYFATNIIGRFDLKMLPPNPRTRVLYDTPDYTGYEVVLDVFPDVIAYGILLLPKNIEASERRPVVVCQHGLEGRPQDTIEGDHWAYHDYAASLAKRGFITFSPQNLYIFKDRFRTLQRKANPLGKTLFSVITPQHQQIVDWLKTLPQVDSSRIAFYGLSYGGKTAMRVPALITDYCLSICSADFNEWVWKNASTRAPHSYVWTGEYEIFEFDLGSTFNYAEMAALIAPRPFMVERGHFDTVAPDETVAYEFAKVRHHYAARLKLPPEHCQIEFFVGPHTINGKGTFDFLHRHLNWPKR